MGLLTVPSAHAQGYPGGGGSGGNYPGGGSGTGTWKLLPCNPDGSPNPSAYTDSAGFTRLTGTMTGTSTNSDPDNDGYFEPSRYETGDVIDTPSNPAPGPLQFLYNNSVTTAGDWYNGPGVLCLPLHGRTFATNGYRGNPPTEKELNGGVSSTLNGSVQACFNWRFVDGLSNPLPAPGVPPPGPADHADFLVAAWLGASANYNLGTASPQQGLSAGGSAVDSFGDSVNALVQSPGGAAASQTMTAYHLVRAPFAKNGVATVSMTGTVSLGASDGILYHVYGPNPLGANYLTLTNGSTWAGGWGQLSAGARQDAREVTIGSPIETSYYKGVSQNGNSNRWAHQRNSATGAMAVDAVATWQDYTANSVKGWQINNIPLTATTTNFFSYASYSWTLSGLTLPEAWLTYPTVNPTQFSLLEPDGTKFPLHSTVTVNAADSDGAIATNTYDMTWHLPLEKTVVTNFTQNIPILVGSLQPIVRNASMPSDLQIPGREGEIDWGATSQQFGLPVAVTGTAAGGLLLIPEVASGPGGWLVMAAQILASGASYQLGTSSPNYPGTVPIQGNADYKEYCADVQHQVTTNTDPAHSTDLVRFKPEALASQALAMTQSLGAPTVYSGWGADPYFMNSTAQWQGGWYTDVTGEISDGYDAHGYTGTVQGTIKVPQTPFKYFLWACSYIKPPTN